MLDERSLELWPDRIVPADVLGVLTGIDRHPEGLPNHRLHLDPNKSARTFTFASFVVEGANQVREPAKTWPLMKDPSARLLTGPAAGEVHHDVPVEAHESMELTFKESLLVAVRPEAFRAVFHIRGRADAEALHALGA